MRSLLRVFEVPPIVDSQVDRKLRGLLNLSCPVLQTMSSGEEHVSSDLQRDRKVFETLELRIAHQCCCTLAVQDIFPPFCEQQTQPWMRTNLKESQTKLDSSYSLPQPRSLPQFLIRTCPHTYNPCYRIRQKEATL